jgi:hypothetical protein
MMKSFLIPVVIGLCWCCIALAGDAYPGAPASVVAAYVEADGEGLALDGETAPALLKYVVWTETPGWDSYTVIKSYDIGEVGYSGDKASAVKASVQIIYHVVGEVSGPEFTAKTADEEVTFEVVKKNGKWKISEPQIGPHLTIEGAINTIESGSVKDDPLGKAALKKLRALAE